jgi:hypothetical protein
MDRVILGFDFSPVQIHMAGKTTYQLNVQFVALGISPLWVGRFCACGNKTVP